VLIEIPCPEALIVVVIGGFRWWCGGAALRDVGAWVYLDGDVASRRRLELALIAMRPG
jgi:hypothetical protein